MKNFLIIFWPYIFIFVVWSVFVSPYFLKGLVPFPSTYQVNVFAPWSTYEKFWGPVKNSAMPDIITQIYPWRHLTIEMWRQGELPLWNPYSFSGTPHLANYQSAVFSFFNILFFILPFVDAWSVLVLLQPLMAGVFIYLFVGSLGVSKAGGLMSAISFMFCGFITSWMGYATLGYAILFLPLALYFIEKFYQTENKKFLLLLAFTMPLSFFSGHFQTSLYFLLGVTAYIAYKAFSVKNLRNTIWVGIYTFLGLLLTAPQVIPSIEFYTQSFRSTIFEKSEAIPWKYLPTLLAPDFFGNPVTRNNWFGHYAEWNSYIGVIPLILALYVLLKRNKKISFFFFLGFLSLLLAFNTPLVDLLVSLHIPVFSTSASNRIIVLFSFSFCVLAGFGFDELAKDINKRRLKNIYITTFIFLTIFAFLWALITLKLFIPIEKISIARNNLILPTLFFIGFIIVIFLQLLHKKLVIFAFSLLILLLAFDMFRFATKWIPFDPKQLVFPVTSVSEFFPKISGYHRVFGNLGGEASIYYRLPSVEGYDALYIKRYGEFIKYIENGKESQLDRSVVLLSKNGKYTPEAINLLDIKYIVHKLSDGRAVWAFPFWTYPQNQFKLIFKNDKYEIFENTKVLPHAFLVGKYKKIINSDTVLPSMFNRFNPREEVILEEDISPIESKNQIGKAEIVSYSPTRINIKVDALASGLLFLSENYYPGWKAEISQKQIPILRANYTFRAIPIEKGSYTVSFVYDPISFRIGSYIALLGIVSLLVTYLFKKNTMQSR